LVAHLRIQYKIEVLKVVHLQQKSLPRPQKVEKIRRARRARTARRKLKRRRKRKK
jgi:hypothetical protein